MSLKNWFSKLGKWGKSTAPLAMEQRQKKLSEDLTYLSASMEKASTDVAIKIQETSGIEDVVIDSASLHNPCMYMQSHPSLYIRKKGDKFFVYSYNKTFESDNFFNVMIHIAEIYGVKLDEDFNSKT